MRDSIVGEGAVLAPGAVVEGGSLVAAGVVLGSGAKVVGARVSLEPYDGEVAVGESTRASFLRVAHVTRTLAADTRDVAVGEGGTGYFWPAEELGADEEDSDDEDALDPRNLSVTRLGACNLAVGRRRLG